MEPSIPDWLITRVFIVDENDSEFPNFTPSAQNNVASGRQTRFEINGLTPGVTYAIKAQIIDSQGNVGNTTAVIQQATQRVGPYHENINGQQDQLVRNNDFNIFTLGSTVPPDFWRVQGSTVWDTHASLNTADSATGTNSIDLDSDLSVNAGLRSENIPVNGADTDTADIVQVSAIVKRVSGTVGQVQLNLRLQWRDENDASVGQTVQLRVLGSGSNWQIFQNDPVIAPVGARFVYVEVIGFDSVNQVWTMRVDRTSLLRGYANGHVQGPGVIAVDSTSYVDLEWDSTSDIGADDIGVNHLAVLGATGNNRDVIEIIYPGVYIITAYVHSNSASTSTQWHFSSRIRIDQGSGFTPFTEMTAPSEAADTAEFTMTTGAVELAKGDRINVQGKVDTIVTPHNMLHLMVRF